MPEVALMDPETSIPAFVWMKMPLWSWNHACYARGGLRELVEYLIRSLGGDRLDIGLLTRAFDWKDDGWTWEWESAHHAGRDGIGREMMAPRGLMAENQFIDSDRHPRYYGVVWWRKNHVTTLICAIMGFKIQILTGRRIAIIFSGQSAGEMYSFRTKPGTSPNNLLIKFHI